MTTTSEQQFVSHSDLIASIVDGCLNTGYHNDGRHSISLDASYTIWVRENATGRLVAYSSMKADFESSLVEFVTDYFA
jgi:hypothetical protein